MKKQILYILFLLPAIFLFEKGICQNQKKERRVLMLEKTMNIYGKTKVYKRKFLEHQRVEITLKDNSKVRGHIIQISDSTINIKNRHDIEISDIKKISHYSDYTMMAIGVSLMLVGGSIMYAAFINGTITYGAYAGFIPAEIGLCIFVIGTKNKVAKPKYSIDKGWKMHVVTIPSKYHPSYHN
jgi:hypothetical protein